MLYLSFRVVIFFTSIIGLLMMIDKGEYTFIFFPIITLFWPLYTFFDAEDTEHKRRNGDFYEIGSSGFNRDSGWLGDIVDYELPMYSRYDNPYYNGYRNHQDYKSEEYKKIVKRCKRTLKVSIAKDSKNNGN